MYYLCSFEFCGNGCGDGDQAEEKDGGAATDDGRHARGLFHWGLQIGIAGTKLKLCGEFAVVSGGTEQKRRSSIALTACDGGDLSSPQGFH